MGKYRDVLERGGNLEGLLSAEGRLFQFSDADFNDLVTGQTSFDETTPTFTIEVPSNTTAVVFEGTLSQTGTVAGDTVNVIVGVDNIAGRASGGTTETPFCLRTDSPLGTVAAAGTGANKVIVYSNPTKAAGFGARLMGPQPLGQDVSPAEGISNEILLPNGPIFLVGPACYAVYAYAGTTGPTLGWSFRVGEFPTKEL